MKRTAFSIVVRVRDPSKPVCICAPIYTFSIVTAPLQRPLSDRSESNADQLTIGRMDGGY